MDFKISFTSPTHRRKSIKASIFESTLKSQLKEKSQFSDFMIEMQSICVLPSITFFFIFVGKVKEGRSKNITLDLKMQFLLLSAVFTQEIPELQFHPLWYYVYELELMELSFITRVSLGIQQPCNSYLIIFNISQKYNTLESVGLTLMQIKLQSEIVQPISIIFIYILLT